MFRPKLKDFEMALQRFLTWQNKYYDEGAKNLLPLRL